MSWYDLLPQILNMSLTASVIIIAVLLVRLALKKAPKIFSYALWAVVLFRLLCPVSISSDISLFNAFDTPTTESGRIEYIQTDRFQTIPPPPTLPEPDAGDAAITDPGIPSVGEPLSPDPEELLLMIAAGVWLGGIAVLLTVSIVRLVRLRRRLIGAVPLRKNIYLADHITSPFVLGLFRPKVYLPSSLSEKEQTYIIRHEQHHIRRCDHLIKILAFAALGIHWFNPLVWVAFLLSCKDMEMSCDEAVMKQMDGDIRAEYSASLLRLATGRKLITGTPLAFGEGDTKGRVKNVMKYKKPTFWAILAALILCVTMAGCFLTNPTDPDAGSTSSGSAESDVPVRSALEEEYPELTELLSLPVKEIQSRYGALTLEYSEDGPGQPVYSIKNFPGVQPVFQWDMSTPLEDDMIPAEIILTDAYEGTFKGLAVGTKIESAGGIPVWDDAGYHVINGTTYTTVSLDGYSLTAYISGSGLGLPAEDTADQVDWEAWSEDYRKAPTGEILQLRLKKTGSNSTRTETDIFYQPSVDDDTSVEGVALTESSAAAFIQQALNTLTVHSDQTISFQLPQVIPTADDGQTRLDIWLRATFTESPGVYSVQRLIDHETDWNGGDTYRGALETERGDLLSVMLRIAFQTEVDTDAYQTYAANYVELTAPFDYDTPAVSDAADVRVMQEGQKATLLYRFSDRQELNLSLQLPEEWSLAIGSSEYASLPPSLSILQNGVSIGSLRLYELATSDTEALAQIDTSANELPMQIFAGVALSNHAGYEDYTVRNSSDTGASATASFVWQDLNDASGTAASLPWQKADCVLAYDWARMPYFMELLLEDGILTDDQLADIAESIRIELAIGEPLANNS